MSPSDAGSAERAELELELRLLPGVVNVGTAADGAITVVALEAPPSLAEAVSRTARLHALEATVTLVDLAAPSRGTGTRGRVALVRASFDLATGTAQVELAHGDRHGSGQAASGPVVGAVGATLIALADLGVHVPFYLLTAGPPLSTAVAGPSPAVLVVLRPLGAPASGDIPAVGGDRMGVARGASEEEAAARATLAALNRFLSPDTSAS